MRRLALSVRSMSRSIVPVPTFAVALGLLWGAASESDAAIRWGINAFGGYQGYSMGDVNDVINQVNEDLSTPGDEARIDELKGDISVGGGVKADLNPNWRVYLQYEHLKDDTGGGTLVGSFTLDVSANAFLAGATYFFPSQSKARVGVGAGLGYYDFGGDMEGNATIGTTPLAGSASAGGSTIGFHGLGELDVTLSERWHFDAAAGYRSAKGELEAEGESTGIDLDWSGIMTRVGVTFFVR
ncbi:MAG: hypothetical protein ACREOU_09760 [Candidatus Eiseniibacteriota bacterium]